MKLDRSCRVEVFLHRNQPDILNLSQFFLTYFKVPHDLAAGMKMSCRVNSISSNSLSFAQTAIGVVVAASVCVIDFSVKLIDTVGIHEAKFKNSYSLLF